MDARPRSRSAPARRAAQITQRNTQITERDRELLAFMACHKLALAAHVETLLDISAGAADTRLRALAAAGLLTRKKLFNRRPACYQITRKGLAAIDSELPVPRIDLRSYEHDMGLAWLWLAARAGTFGELREIRSERQLRSHDLTPEGRADPFGVRLGGFGARGRERLHYPDLLLTDPRGHRIAIELELTTKERTRREQILGGYALDARIDAVAYFVERPAVGRAIRASAAKLGISRLVHVQGVRLSTGVENDAVAARRRVAENEAQATR